MPKLPRRQFIKGAAAAAAVTAATQALPASAALADPSSAQGTGHPVGWKLPITTNSPSGHRPVLRPVLQRRPRIEVPVLPRLGQLRPRGQVLLYTRTAGPRHADLGPALAPGLNPPLTAATTSCRTP